MSSREDSVDGATPARQKLLCMFGKHRPRNRQASWDGTAYISRCEDCDRPIRRVGRHKWRIDEERAED
ncbi:hypothetical protein [Aurantiacibacter poecillastricola]|uniref:hypothetical protein n=1 Tax=Aurantiacibacter poecillastricola TaxID=3064385 RepID=UPI00273E0CE3|nr:hypothetical protein [Aurantiacibacter sp. 219JJ12-13]MDP5260809.1 hypothetical protein [Aurantiacibacter sp. 219JJ12-13]